jgi:hypothetical protein
MSVLSLEWPVYSITNRSGHHDVKSLYVKELPDETDARAISLFTKIEFAQRYLVNLHDQALSPAHFSNATSLIAMLQQAHALNCFWVVIDETYGEKNGKHIRIDDIVARLEANETNNP